MRLLVRMRAEQAPLAQDGEAWANSRGHAAAIKDIKADLLIFTQVTIKTVKVNLAAVKN